MRSPIPRPQRVMGAHKGCSLWPVGHASPWRCNRFTQHPLHERGELRRTEYSGTSWIKGFMHFRTNLDVRMRRLTQKTAT